MSPIIDVEFGKSHRLKSKYSVSKDIVVASSCDVDFLKAERCKNEGSSDL